jgi:hypothetical protein
MINITGSITNINENIDPQLIQENLVNRTIGFASKYITTPSLSPEQINQITLKNIKTKEIYKLGSDLVRNIIK